MAISTNTVTLVERALHEADQLQGRLSQIKSDLSDQTSAATNAQDDTFTNLRENIFELDYLQKKVQAIFDHGLARTTKTDEQQLDQVSNKVYEITEIVESIITNQCQKISSTARGLFHRSNLPKESEISLLQRQIANWTSSTPLLPLNQENREALKFANESLEFFLSQYTPTKQPLIIPNNTKPTPSGYEMLKQGSDENHQCSLFSGQLKEIKDAFNVNNIQVDFEKVLAHYKRVKEYASSPLFFASETAGPAVADHLQKIEKLLEQIIGVQRSREGRAIQHVQSPAEYSPTLTNFNVALEKAIAAQSDTDNLLYFLEKASQAYTSLESKEKTNFFNTLSTLLIDERRIERKLPDGLRGQPFSALPGSLEQKQKALKQVINDSIAFAPQTESEKMNERFLKLKEMVSLDTPYKLNFNMESLSDVMPISSSPEVSSNLAIIQDLQEILPLLDPNASHRDLQQACELLIFMDSKGYKSLFKVSDRANPKSIADRPYFHLYFIHKKEHLREHMDDIHYGNKAFAGEYPASNEERSRALKRTIVELALEDLERAIQFNDEKTLYELLSVLETIPLDEKDRINNRNIAYSLFDTFHDLYIEAYSHNPPSLISPFNHDDDFGRNGFYSRVQGINPEIKINAIQNIRKKLKEVWNLQ